MLWGEGVMLRREVEEAKRLLDLERESVGDEVRAAREALHELREAEGAWILAVKEAEVR